MFRQTKISIFLLYLELRAVINRHGTTVASIRAIISIAPILIVSLASIALNTYVLKNVIQDTVSLIFLTNTVPVLLLTRICHNYFLSFERKFPKRIFNQPMIEMTVWKGSVIILLSLLYGLVFSLLTYSPDFLFTSVLLFLVMTTASILLVNFLHTLLVFLKKYKVTDNKERNNSYPALIWYKYFLGFRLRSPNGQSGLFVATLLFSSAIYFIEESLLLSLSLLSLSVSFIFFDLITENVLRHKIFVYCNISSAVFFRNSYALIVLVYLTAALFAFSASFFGYGSALWYISIPVGFGLFTLFDSIASLSVSGSNYRKITRRILIPLGVGAVLIFNPIFGLLLFAGTTIWFFLGFKKRWQGIPYDDQVE